MSDRYNSLTVVLDREIRDDQAQEIINAIKQIKNVIEVSGNISDYDQYSAKVQARWELRKILWKALEDYK